jgi:hypothetical protein
MRCAITGIPPPDVTPRGGAFPDVGDARPTRRALLCPRLTDVFAYDKVLHMDNKTRVSRHCKACGHDWLARKPEPPRRCPRCQVTMEG